MYAAIKLAAEHGKLTLVKNQYLAAKNYNSVFMEFYLRSEDWLACEDIVAIFNNTYTRRLKGKLKCDIPPEVMSTPGEFCVGLYGVNGDVRMSTNKIYFTVDEGSYTGAPPYLEKEENTDIYDGGDVNGEIDTPDEDKDVERVIIYDGGGANGF